ncbi:MAG TPA: hypothetical protein PKG87_08055, partial [Nitrospira sp.]|nr:hypothetical protein [Nitrospira sp.]
MKIHYAAVLALSFIAGIWISFDASTAEAQSRFSRKRQVQTQSVTPPTTQTTAARDYSILKIVPPPAGGLYMGQYEWVQNDIASFESASGRKTALWSKYRGSWGNGYDAA